MKYRSMVLVFGAGCLVARAAELVTASSGSGTNQAKISFEVTDEPVTYYDAWDVIGGFEARTYTIVEGHIGYVDLNHGVVNRRYGMPLSTAPYRYFHQQKLKYKWDIDYSYTGRKTAVGSWDITMRRADSNTDTVTDGQWDELRTSAWQDVEAWDMYGTPIGPWYTETDTIQLAAQPKFQNYVPVFLGTKSQVSGRPGAAPTTDAYLQTPFDTFLWTETPFYQKPSTGIFVAPPQIWEADHATWTGASGIQGDSVAKDAVEYSIEMNDEDTLSDVTNRITQDRAIVAFDTIAWNQHRYAQFAKFAGDSREWDDDIWLYNSTQKFSIYGSWYEERTQIRFNVPPELRISGVGYRGRVIEYFYPDSDPHNRQIVKVHEVTMHEGQWESPVITPVIRNEDGFTVMEDFTAVAELVHPQKVLVFSPPNNQPPTTAPAEYLSSRPTIVSQPQVKTATGATDINRRVLVGSTTLQQINLSDSWGVLTIWTSATAKWSVLPGATADLRLWHWRDDGSGLGIWSLLQPGDDLVPYYDASKDYIFAEAMTPGSATIRITLKINGQELYDDLLVSSAPARIAIAVDANRDGTIDLPPSSAGAAYADATSSDRPYRFWANDDNDSGSIDTADIPGSSTPDGQQVTVKGVRDVIDYFPVCLDLKQLVTALPPSASVKYKLKQADDALRFVYTDLSRADAFSYLRDYDTANALQAADAHRITSDGWELDATWLGQVGSADKGVILVEGRDATTEPLVLSVEKDGAVIADVRLYLNIGPVEKMFRHLNLHDRGLPGLVGSMTGGTAQPQAMGDPVGFPDNQNSNDCWLVFIHGFNVSGAASRGWNAEMFKRFYWSGNKARFVGVSWFGNPDDAIGPLPSDYYRSVRNAMVSAPALAQEINALSGTKTIIGHSLGCGVIASAVVDYGMSVSKACFVDAALAGECFDGEVTSSADGMTPRAWKTYASRSYATNWYKLFTSEDARSKLTWRNRFAGMAASVHNFYSSTENVLGEYTGEVPENVFEVAWTSGTNGAFTWVFQEKAKGVRGDFLLGVTHVGSYYGGWGFNTTDPLSADDQVYYNLLPNTSGVPTRQPKTNDQIGAPSDDVLRRVPVFDPGWGNPQGGANRVVDSSIVRGPSWIAQLYDGSGRSAVAATPVNRNQLLAEAVPALTWPVGSHVVQSFEERNYPLTTYTYHWPRALVGGVPEWRHSDMREVAYLYQYRFFDKLVTISTQ